MNPLLSSISWSTSYVPSSEPPGGLWGGGWCSCCCRSCCRCCPIASSSGEMGRAGAWTRPGAGEPLEVVVMSSSGALSSAPLPAPALLPLLPLPAPTCCPCCPCCLALACPISSSRRDEACENDIACISDSLILNLLKAAICLSVGFPF